MLHEKISDFFCRMFWGGVPQEYLENQKGSPSLVDIQPTLLTTGPYSYRRFILRRIIARELIGFGYSVSEAQELLGLNPNDQPKQPGVALTVQDFLDGEWRASEFVTLYDIVEKLKLRFPDIPDGTND